MEQFEIESLGIKYSIEQREAQDYVLIRKDDFEKIFEKMNQMQNKINDLQNQVIEELKRQALIKNILNS